MKGREIDGRVKQITTVVDVPELPYRDVCVGFLCLLIESLFTLYLVRFRKYISIVMFLPKPSCGFVA